MTDMDETAVKAVAKVIEAKIDSFFQGETGRLIPEEIARAAIAANPATARVAKLEEALAWYGHTFCELGKHHECCGRLTEDDCSGCRARQALVSGESA